MNIPVTCSQCGKNLHVAEQYGGKRAKCPSCGNIIHIPILQRSPPQSTHAGSPPPPPHASSGSTSPPPPPAPPSPPTPDSHRATHDNSIPPSQIPTLCNPSRLNGVVPLHRNATFNQLKAKRGKLQTLLTLVPIGIFSLLGLLVVFEVAVLQSFVFCCLTPVALAAGIPISIAVHSSVLKSHDQKIAIEIVRHNQRNTNVVGNHILDSGRTDQALQIYALGNWSRVVFYNSDLVSDLEWDRDVLLLLTVDEIHRVNCTVRHVGSEQTGSSTITYAGAFQAHQNTDLSGRVRDEESLFGSPGFSGSMGGIGYGSFQSNTMFHHETVIDIYTRNREVPHHQVNFRSDELGGKQLEAIIQQGLLDHEKK